MTILISPFLLIMVGIYKIESPTGKVYVGQSVNIKNRFRLYRKLQCKGQTKLYNSLYKYGTNHHTFEILEECLPEQLNVRERYWQDFYDVLGPKGLNCKLTRTEDKSGIRSQESRLKSSINRLNFYQTEEGKQVAKLHSVTRRAYNRTLEGRQKIAEVVLNTDYSIIAKKNSKPIVQLSKLGEIVRNWSSQKEAGKQLGISPRDISACLRGRSKSSGGFIWKYR